MKSLVIWFWCLNWSRASQWLFPHIYIVSPLREVSNTVWRSSFVKGTGGVAPKSGKSFLPKIFATNSKPLSSDQISGGGRGWQHKVTTQPKWRFRLKTGDSPCSSECDEWANFGHFRQPLCLCCEKLPFSGLLWCCESKIWSKKVWRYSKRNCLLQLKHVCVCAWGGEGWKGG